MRDARRSAGAHPRKAGNNAVAALSWLPLIMEITNGVEGLGAVCVVAAACKALGIAAPPRLASHPQAFNANLKLYVNTPQGAIKPAAPVVLPQPVAHATVPATAATCCVPPADGAP